MQNKYDIVLIQMKNYTNRTYTIPMEFIQYKIKIN